MHILDEDGAYAHGELLKSEEPAAEPEQHLTAFCKAVEGPGGMRREQTRERSAGSTSDDASPIENTGAGAAATHP